nr:thermonuclease family protein [Polaromonas sp. OV174]
MRTLLSLALLLPVAAQAQQSCLVVGVTDGDTIKARCGQPGAYEQVKVRIAEIDAPEKRQPFGERSRQSLAGLCHEAQAVIKPTAKDRYGRTVARVSCNGQDVSLHQVRAGMAWWYVKYGKDMAVQDAERQARSSRAGLWVDSEPIPPWEWRKSKKTEAIGN